MKNFTKKLLVLLIGVIISISFVACDQTNTQTQVSDTTAITTITTTEGGTTSNTITTVPTINSTTNETTTQPTSTEETTTTTTFFRDLSRITIEIPNKVIYQVNETLDLTGLVVTYYDRNNNPTILTSSQYSVGSVDMTTNGIKYIEITYLTYSTRFTIEVQGESNNNNGGSGSGNSSYDGTYYQGVDDSNGTALRSDLYSLMNSTKTTLSYNDAKWVLPESDQDPNNPAKMILVYLRTSVNGQWDSAATWNREHTWPQSKLPSSEAKSDVHNLKPSNPRENSIRGNLPFSEYGSGYEPHDDVKGDVARIIFYMAVTYNMTLNNSSSPGMKEMGKIDELLVWHVQDPVDDFEMNRNNVIEIYQGNRNPFIDHPEWVEIIWN